jgi:hypothetical protein
MNIANVTYIVIAFLTKSVREMLSTIILVYAKDFSRLG